MAEDDRRELNITGPVLSVSLLTNSCPVAETFGTGGLCVIENTAGSGVHCAGTLDQFPVLLARHAEANVMRGEDENAIYAIRHLRGINDGTLLRAEMEDIRIAYNMEQELYAGVHLKDMF